MQLGMIGLGRMGSNLVRRLLGTGHECVVYDIDRTAMAGLVADGATPSDSFADLVSKLHPPRNVWIMLPAGIVQRTVEELNALLDADDVVVDGGNSYYRDDIERSAELAEHGVHFVDCGTSGGVWGLDRGYCLMIGGEAGVVSRLDPIWQALAPGEGDTEPTPGRDQSKSTAHRGYLHCGPTGAGHFVKMIHNGIEYGMMGAIAEGLNILQHADIGRTDVEVDAETTPLREPRMYQYDIDIPEVAEVWRRGAVVSSWLVDLTAAALADSPDLSAFAGRVSDSGEGRWTVIAAIEEGVPSTVINAALNARLESRDRGQFADKLLSAMRSEFGGHAEKSQ